LKPAESKGAKAGGNKKENETKATIEEKKSWKAKFATLEAKMAPMNATSTSRGAKLQVAPSFHVSGRFMLDDEEFGDFMLWSMALTVADMILEASARTRSLTTAPKEAPRGASSSLDPQRNEGNRQA
jgi:hypothetical protein